MGFTLFEILIVITIFVLIATFGLFLSMDFYRSYSFHSDTNTAVSVVEKARSESLSNIDQTAHGVKILNSDYIIFEGPSYALRNASKDETIVGNANVIHGGDTEVTFQQLTGSVGAPKTLTLVSGVKTTTITINNEGRIDW